MVVETSGLMWFLVETHASYTERIRWDDLREFSYCLRRQKGEYDEEFLNYNTIITQKMRLFMKRKRQHDKPTTCNPNHSFNIKHSKYYYHVLSETKKVILKMNAWFGTGGRQFRCVELAVEATLGVISLLYSETRSSYDSLTRCPGPFPPPKTLTISTNEILSLCLFWVLL